MCKDNTHTWYDNIIGYKEWTGWLDPCDCGEWFYDIIEGQIIEILDATEA